MKSLKTLLWLLVTAMTFSMVACNNDKKEKDKDAQKVTEIPATTHSQEALASFQKGLAAFDVFDNVTANAAFSKALEQDPKFGIAYLFKAISGTSSKEFADNLSMGKTNLDSASDWEKMYADYLSASLADDKGKQIEVLQKIADAYPDAARAQVDLGNGYTNNNQFDKARTCYQKAVELGPKWVGGYMVLSNSYLFSDPKDLKKAEENAQTAVNIAPTSSLAEIQLGDCYRAQNDFQKARDAYAKAVSLDPTSSAGYYKEGHANTYLGNMDEARKNYADGESHDATQAAAILNSAYTYLYDKNDYKTAMKFIMDGYAKLNPAKEGKAITDEKSTLLTNVATIAAHSNNTAQLKEANALLRPIANQIANDLGNTESKAFAVADSLNWDAMIAITEGKLDDAAASAEKMKTTLDPIKDDTKLQGYHQVMGMISMKQKKYSDAISHFEKADPNLIYNKYCLAMAHEANGDKDKAMSLYKEVANYNFNDVGNALVRNDVKKKLAMNK